jgi:hypothetical protein
MRHKGLQRFEGCWDRRDEEGTHLKDSNGRVGNSRVAVVPAARGRRAVDLVTRWVREIALGHVAAEPGQLSEVLEAELAQVQLLLQRKGLRVGRPVPRVDLIPTQLHHLGQVTTKYNSNGTITSSNTLASICSTMRAGGNMALYNNHQSVILVGRVKRDCKTCRRKPFQQSHKKAKEQDNFSRCPQVTKQPQLSHVMSRVQLSVVALLHTSAPNAL